MKWGVIKLFCPICGIRILYNGNIPSIALHSKEFGWVCGEKCYKEAELKYARMILGKDDDAL